MAQSRTGAVTAGENAEEAALIKEREAMLGRFTTAATYAVAVVAGVLVLLAIFLL